MACRRRGVTREDSSGSYQKQLIVLQNHFNKRLYSSTSTSTSKPVKPLCQDQHSTTKNRTSSNPANVHFWDSHRIWLDT